jgi:hypothetical protein
MRFSLRLALSHDHGARGKGRRHGGGNNHPKAKIVGIDHGLFRNGLVVVLVGTSSTAIATTTTTTTIVAIVASIVTTVTTVRARAGGVVAIAIAIAVGVGVGRRITLLIVSTVISQGSFDAAAGIVARTSAD